MKTIKTKTEEIIERDTNQVNPTIIANTNNSIEDTNENFNMDPDKKDVIPLLIIDVNIRPGVKKKIYVFDGDTADALAERFSREHSKTNFIN